MRATSTVVVFSSLLLATVAVAGPGDKKAPAKADKKAPAKGDKKAGSGSGSDTTTASTAGSAATPAPSPTPAPSTDLASVKPEDRPTAVRMRRLEQKTQALKERAWQLKARVQMLKEQMLGGGVGAQALVSHANDMGSSFRLVKLVYTLDGTQIFARTDESAETLHKTKAFDVFTGPISPGNHNLAMIATYKGHGYGVFEYLSKFTFTARNTAAFTTTEGKISKVECKGYEKGGAATPMEKRPAIECKVTEVQPEKPAEGPKAPTSPGTTPLPPAAGAGK